MFCARYLISILFVTACVYSTKQGDLSSGKDVEVTINNNTEDVSKSNGKKETVDIGPTDSLHRNESSIPIPPRPSPSPNSTTVSPSTTTKSTTVSPSTTSKSTTVSPSTTTKSTTVSPSTTTKSTTVSPSTTVKPNSTTVNPNSTTTVNPTPVPSSTAKPSPDPEPSRKFDGPSFVGGIVLALGLVGIGFVAFKFYKARLEVNYHTL